MKNNVLFIAPHADDEILGCGATIYKMVQEGHNVYVLIMTNASKSDPNIFSEKGIQRVRTEALEAHRLLGVKQTFFFDFPAPALDQYPGYIMSREVSKCISENQIDTVFIPHRGDIHKDHRMVFDSVLVACRPVGDYTVKRVYTYETLSETEWAAPYADDAFIPTVFIPCSQDGIKMKLRAMECYQSQLRRFPSSRSLEALEALADFAGGDARVALNLLEQAEFMLPDGSKEITMDVLRSVAGNALQRYDKKGDYHYDIVSAFIKSMRGSDADAALHYLARMLEGGEDVRFIARRIVICAAEDVGNADPQALVVANAAAQAAHFVGLPEAQIPLAQAVCYIANAPKSNSCYMGIFNARQEVRSINTRVPKHLRDAHYPGAKQFGHGLGYKYPHDYPGGWVEQQYLPDELVGHKYYYPKDIGEESRLLKKKNEKD